MLVSDSLNTNHQIIHDMQSSCPCTYETNLAAEKRQKLKLVTLVVNLREQLKTGHIRILFFKSVSE
jgi:hypothetical protein